MDEAMARRLEALRGLEHEIGVLLRRVRRVMSERAALVHPELNVTAYVLLGTLGQFGPRRASELADQFDLDKGAVSRVVHQLLELGLIERQPDPQDGRASILRTSELGDARLAEVAELRRRQVAEHLADWEPGTLQRLAEELREYNEALGNL